MVNKIIISDYYGTAEDLIIFEESVRKEDVENVVEKVRETVEDYMFEDIYEAIKKEFKVKQVIDLSSMPYIVY